MATLSTLLSDVGIALGTATSNIFTNDKKTDALNWARKYLLTKYEVDEFIVETTLTFTSGKASIPSDYLRWVRIFDPNSKSTHYHMVNVNTFDGNISKSITIKDDSGTRKFHVYPTDTTSVTLRYIKLPTDMNVASDESVFNAVWDEAHASLSAYRLLSNDRQFQSAQAKLMEAEQMIGIILQHLSQNTDEIKTFLSVYNNHGLLQKNISPTDVE